MVNENESKNEELNMLLKRMLIHIIRIRGSMRGDSYKTLIELMREIKTIKEMIDLLSVKIDKENQKMIDLLEKDIVSSLYSGEKTENMYDLVRDISKKVRSKLIEKGEIEIYSFYDEWN